MKTANYAALVRKNPSAKAMQEKLNQIAYRDYRQCTIVSAVNIVGKQTNLTHLIDQIAAETPMYILCQEKLIAILSKDDRFQDSNEFLFINKGIRGYISDIPIYTYNVHMGHLESYVLLYKDRGLRNLCIKIAGV